MRRHARETALTRNTKLVAKATENYFIPIMVFYASSHPRNAMEPTAVLSPNKNAKSNPSPPEIDIWVPFFEESF